MNLPIAIDFDLPPNARNVICRVGPIALSESATGPQPDQDRENAEYIVKAVNHHNELVAMLERYQFSEPGPQYVAYSEPAVTREEACALLAKVKS